MVDGIVIYLVIGRWIPVPADLNARTNIVIDDIIVNYVAVAPSSNEHRPLIVVNTIIPNNVTVAPTPRVGVVAVDTETVHMPDFIGFNNIISANEIQAIPPLRAVIQHNVMNLIIAHCIDTGPIANHNPNAKQRLPRNDVLEFTI